MKKALIVFFKKNKNLNFK